jgi:hypothetical protein
MLAGIWFPFAFFPAVLFLSATVQSLRAGMKTDSSKLSKRLTRMLGFLLGFAFSPVLGVCCSLVALIIAFKSKTDAKMTISLPSFSKLQLVMILHQAHYFVYCYVVLIGVYQYGGAVLAAVLFFAGWLAYVFAPFLYRQFIDYRHIFLIGHSLLATLLIAMFAASSTYLKILLWLLTGLGGTTEFCIAKLERERGEYNEANHNSAESFGHVLGTAVSATAVTLTANLNLPVLLSACFASAVIAFMLSLKRSEPV